MKIIKSKKYIKKEAIWSMPVGDPGLPGQMTERDIPEGIEPDNSIQHGESEIEVSWTAFLNWYKDRLPNEFSNKPDIIKVNYTYSYITPGEIEVVSIFNYDTQQTISKSDENAYFIESIADYYKDKILEDIKTLNEEDEEERHFEQKTF